MPTTYTLGGVETLTLGGRLDILIDDLYAAEDADTLIESKTQELNANLKKMWALGKDQLKKVEGA